MTNDVKLVDYDIYLISIHPNLIAISVSMYSAMSLI